MASETESFKRSTLETIAGGVVPELFQDALCRVLANIDDLNCDAKAKRGLTVEMTFEPDASRQALNIKVSVKTKLAAPKKAESTVFLVRDQHGAVFAVESNPNQPELFKS